MLSATLLTITSCYHLGNFSPASCMAKDCVRLKVAAWSKVLQSGSKADIPLSSSFGCFIPTDEKAGREVGSLSGVTESGHQHT